MEEPKHSVLCSEPIELDLSLSFEEAIRDVFSAKKNRHISAKVKGKVSDNYMVLKALFNGSPEPIDAYDKVPWNADGEPMNNIRSRIGDLRGMYNLKINRRRKEGTNQAEFWIE